MVTNDLGACEWFVWDLRKSGLIDRGQLDQIVGEFLRKNPRAEAPALAQFLVQHNTITNFQAERILNGKTQGLVLGPYVLLDAIGQGSMGQVYKATSKNDSGLYAVKVLPRRSMWNVRLARRQVRSFAAFTHPAVVPFVDVGTAGGLHYLAWPLAEGTTLEAMVQHNGRLNAQQTALVGLQIAQGLAVCHQNGIFHGLVKPSNVMIGSDNQARLLDFGIGCLLAENEGETMVDTMSTANTLTSGLDYTAPESIMEPTNRTPAGDQYSIGCTLYYCLTGRVPFPEGSAVEKMMAHQSKEPLGVRELAPDCPEGLVAVIARLMAKTPEGRYTGTDEVVEALEPYLGELAGAGVEATPAPAARTAGGRPSNTGSSGRMDGIFGQKSAFPSTPPAKSFASPNLTPTTPAPTGRLVNTPPIPVPQKPTFNKPPAPAPLPGRMDTFQGRKSFGAPPSPVEDMVLTPAGGVEQPPFVDPLSKLKPTRPAASWVPDEEAAETAGKPAQLGTIGIVAAALVLMVLVFIGAKLLMSS